MPCALRLGNLTLPHELLGLWKCVTGVPSVGEGPGLGAARESLILPPKLKENLKTEVIEQGKFLL